ncbi:MAG: DMT family transporter [Magnetospirillum sp.]|nr:DMT family transporter [Magnetospirillum sp.]
MRNGLIYLELTCSALFWGLTFNAAKLTVGAVPPMTTAALRFLVAAGLMLVLLLSMERNWGPRVRRNWLAFLAMAVAGVVGFNTFFFFGMQYTSPTNGALIMATNPLVTALIAALFLGEPISHNHKVGTAISFVGVAILILSGASHRLSQVNIGDLLVIGGNVSMALYSVLNKRFVKESSPLITTAATTIAGAVILWSVARTMDPPTAVTALPWQTYAAILFMGAFGSVLAYIFWNRGIRAIGVADTAIFFHLVPVFTVLGSFVLGQTVTLTQIGAGMVVIFGVMISSGALKKLLTAIAPRPVAAPAEITPASDQS